MHNRKPIFAAFSALLLPCLLESAHGQNQAQPAAKDARKPVQVRVLCSKPVEGATELCLVQGEEVLHQLELIPSMVSDPLGIGRGTLIVARHAEGDQPPKPLIGIPVPDAGTRFALALFPAAAADSENVYQHILIRTDNLRFDIADLHLSNLTQVAIGGTLGSRKFVLAPGKSDVVKPDAPDGDRMYQARFYYELDGNTQLFSDTRWPLAASARVYLFFIPDPEKQTVTYLSFREYAPFP